MIAFLYSLPGLGVAALFGSVLALVFAMAPLLRLLLFGHVSDANSEIARTTTTAITGRSVQQTVSSEAMQLNRMDRLLVLYGDAKVSAIRETLHTYTESIVADEWPKVSVHSSSQRTAELFDTLSQRILAIQPTPGRENVIYADLVKVADQLEQSREDRLNATDLGLPPIFWEVIAVLTVLLIGFAAFVEPRRARAMSLGGLGAGLALLIALVFIFDQPFLGDVSVTPDAIVRALTTMRAS
jgi:hypothetical protein